MVPAKHPDDRRREILDAAERIFCQQGYERSSVNDILEAVSIAKGTFYYHFESKESVMDAIIDRVIDDMSARAEAIVSQSEMPVFQRLLAIVMANRIADPSQGFVAELNRPQNSVFHQRAQRQTLQALVPYMAKLAEEGIDQGIMSTPYPYEAMEMILTYGFSAFDDAEPSSEEAMARKVQAFVYHVERILGVDTGTLDDLVRLLHQD